MRTSTFEKNNLPQLGVSELWLVVFHATTSLRASQCPWPIQNLNNSLHSSKVPAGSPGSLPSTLWGGFEPGKAKTMYNGPSSTTHDPVMKRREYGWRGWWERKGREVERTVDVQAFSVRKRGVVHANQVLLFSATGVQDSLTKAQQMDQAGPQSPQKKCAVIITTFFHTKPLCSHGHAWLHVRKETLYVVLQHSISHSCLHPVDLLYCLDHSALSFCLYQSFVSASIFVCERIFAYFPSYTDIFVAEFRETRSPRQVIHIDSQLSAPIGCQKLLLFRLPQNLTVFRMPSLIPQALYAVWDLYSTQSMFDSWFTVEKMMGKRRTCRKSSLSGFQ